MNNKFISRNFLNNLNLSSFKSNLPPDVFLDQKNFKDSKNIINLPQKILHKEYQIFRTFHKDFGSKFSDVKPASLLLFEKGLKQFFLSSNFLKSFINKKSNVMDGKINIGSLDFYALSDKRYKKDVMISANREKVLSLSRNFELKPSKDILSQEYFKMKYMKKNAKRIAKILSKKNKNKNDIMELGYDIDDFLEVDNDYEDDKFDTLEINTHLLEKRRKSETINNQDQKKYLSFNKNLNINNTRNEIKHKSVTNKNRQDLLNLQIFEYTNKKKPKIKNNYWLNTSNINSNEYLNRNIMSTIFRKKKERLNLTEYNKSKKRNKKLFISNNIDAINFTNHKYQTHFNFINEHSDKKKNNLFLLDIQKIKKLSKKYQIGIKNNVNDLDDYTKICKSKLLNLLYRNNIDKKIYIMKVENKTELNELKDLLFNDQITSKKNINTKKDDSQKQILNQKENKFSNTMDLKNTNIFKTIQRRRINKKVINLEIKDIINNYSENQRKKNNLDNIREKCKENYKTIIKMRENIKYNKQKLDHKYEKFKIK